MPFDLSEIFGDPEMVDFCKVTRRTETIGDGYSRETTTTFDRVPMIIASSTPDNVVRNDAFDTTERTLSLVAAFELRGSKDGQKPDQFVWRGKLYEVAMVEDYSRYGPGFSEVTAKQIDW